MPESSPQQGSGLSLDVLDALVIQITTTQKLYLLLNVILNRHFN